MKQLLINGLNITLEYNARASKLDLKKVLTVKPLDIEEIRSQGFKRKGSNILHLKRNKSCKGK